MEHEKQVGTHVVSTKQMETVFTDGTSTSLKPTGYIRVEAGRISNTPIDQFLGWTIKQRWQANRNLEVVFADSRQELIQLLQSLDGSSAMDE